MKRAPKPRPVEQRPAPVLAPLHVAGGPRLLALEDVAARLGVHVRTLRRRMAESDAAGVRPGWIYLGGRMVRWREADLDRWLTEMDEWQRSNGAAMDGTASRSGGEGSTDAADATRSPTSAPRTASRRRSTAPTLLESSGSPRAIVKALLASKM